MGYLVSNVQRERARDSVRRVDPAIQVKHVVGHLLGVDAVDGVPHILARRHDHREREQDDRADGPVEAEHRGIDVHMAHLHQRLEAKEDVQHLGRQVIMVVVAAASDTFQPKIH